MEFCSHFEQIAYPPNFLRELALKFCFRQKSLKLRHSSNWAANLFKIWQNSNAALSVASLVFIIYQKSKVRTIIRLENLCRCVCWMLLFSIYVVADRYYYCQYSKTYTPTSGFDNWNYQPIPFNIHSLCGDLNSVLLYESERR